METYIYNLSNTASSSRVSQDTLSGVEIIYSDTHADVTY